MKWINLSSRYAVSRAGEVLDRKTGRTLGQWKNDQGYMLVRLCEPRRTVRVHRLIAAAFCPNPMGLPFVNHKDCIRSNNKASNLEWCTQWGNLNHSRKLGRMQNDYWKGKRSPNAKLDDETIFAIRSEYSKGEVSWQTLGKKFGASKRTIGRIVTNESYKM